MEEIKPSVKVLYTAKIHSKGVCEHGVSRSSDGRLNSKQSTPGTNGVGTSPNNSLLQGGLPVFEGAMGIAALKMYIVLPEDAAIERRSTCVQSSDLSILKGYNGNVPVEYNLG